MAVSLRTDFDGNELRGLAKRSSDGPRARRLLALAAIYDGMNRTEAAAVGLMDRQTLCDWVHRFNSEGPEGLANRKNGGRKRKLDEEQMAELGLVVTAGPDPETDGIVRWRRADLAAVIKKRFDVTYSERGVGELLKVLGFSHISARPQHPEQDAEVIAAFKKTSPIRSRPRPPNSRQVHR